MFGTASLSADHQTPEAQGSDTDWGSVSAPAAQLSLRRWWVFGSRTALDDPNRSGDVIHGGHGLRPGACGLGKAVADLVPRDLGVGMRVGGAPPGCLLCHRP